MTTRDPQSASILAARIARAYPSLSPFSAASLAEELCRIERAQRRHAERCCSGEDGGYTKRTPLTKANAGAARSAWYEGSTAMAAVHDPVAEERAGKRVANTVERWRSRLRTVFMGFGMPRDAVAPEQPVIDLQGDPRGPVLLVRFPGEPEAVWS